MFIVMWLNSNMEIESGGSWLEYFSVFQAYESWVAKSAKKQTKQTKNPTHFCDFSLSHASQVPNTACNQVYVRHSAFGQLTSLSFQIQNCQSGLNCAFFVTIPSHQEKKISSIKNHWNSFLNISTSQWQISPALAQKLKVWEGHCLPYPLLCQIRHKLQGFQWRPSCI